MKFDRKQFVEDVRNLVTQGVVFRHQGSDPATGMDCINTPRWGYERQGLTLPAEISAEFATYGRHPDGEHFLATMRRWFIELEFTETEPGDLFVLYARRNPQHMAIKVTNDDPPRIVEAYCSVTDLIGKLIEWPLDPRRRIAACFRIPDFD